MTEIQIAEYVEAVKEIGRLKARIEELEADIEAYEGMKSGVAIRIADLEAELAVMRKRLECSMRHDSDDDKWKSREHIKCERNEFRETVVRLKKLLFRAVSHCDDETLAGGELVADIRAEIGCELESGSD